MIPTKNQEKHKNNRQHRRFEERCKIEFTANNSTYRGLSSNFSMNGLFIRTNYSFSPGTPLEIVIYLPNGLISKLKGRVRRTLKSPPGKVAESKEYLQRGFGMEIMEQDTNYLHFIRYLLSMEILRKRYSRSEISKEEFEVKKKDLTI